MTRERIRNDKRQDPRINFTLPLSLQLPSGDYDYETNDISLQGLFIEASDPLALQKLVRFQIDLPDLEEPLQMLGLVAHTVSQKEADEYDIEPGMGIRLFALGRRQKQVWREFVLKEYDKREESRADLKHRDTPELQVHLSDRDALKTFIEEDVAEGSTFIQTSNLQEPGTQVLCNITTPDTEQQIQLEAKVIDLVESPRKQRGVRLSIQTLSDEQKDRLESLLDE